MFIFKVLKAVSLFYGFYLVCGSESPDITTGVLCFRIVAGMVLMISGWIFTAYERATSKNDRRIKR